MRRLWVPMIVAVVLAAGTAAQRADTATEARVDEIFSQWTGATPGCTVGVEVSGKVALEKAYGMADLEHDVRNTPDSIFEAGSVSKQFTAAAVLLLAREGKLSLEDPVRKYVPELPDYGSPLLVRHMLNHVSGLRDWGNIEAIAGWPRTSRVYTHAHVLDIVSRQKALNFTPGTQYSYSNTGYNLAAVIVARVSGQSFADFTRDRLFLPLGMTHTSWRDDFTRVVRNRAIAYRPVPGGYAQQMPFENVHGNGGLLTTVGDLLRWNGNFERPRVGDAQFVQRQEEPGRFNDGRPGSYALGLMIGQYKGVREISHGGATAAYRAYLARFPDQRVSVAVLCNAGNAVTAQYAHAVADLYLGSAIQAGSAEPPPRRELPARTFQPTAAQLQSYAGIYTSDEAETTFTIAVEGGALVLKRRPDTRLAMTPTVEDTFSVPSLGTVRFLRGGGRVNELSVSEDRVFDLRFRREAAATSASPSSARSGPAGS